MLKYVLAFLLIACLLPQALADGVERRAPAERIGERLTTQTFVRGANAGNLFEIRSSQLALSRSQDPQVRLFARRIISDHRRAGRQLRAALGKAGLRRQPIRLDAFHLTLLAGVRDTRAPWFESAYISTQIDAHQNAIALHRAYARNGRHAELRQFARNVLPLLERHLDMAHRLGPRVARR